jgi:predicted permease
VDSLLTDLRYGFRSLLNRPGFAALAILTLAIGIGVNTVAFSALNGLFMKPRRFPGAHELGWIMTKAPGNVYGNVSLPDYQDFARANTTLATIGAEGRMALSMRTDGGSEEVWTLLVSTGYLPMLRAQPRIGRMFTDADTADLPVIVSERFWNERLGGGESVAGRTVTLNGRAFSVVGVLPDGFQGPGGLFEPSAWLPIDTMEVLNIAPSLRARTDAWLTVVGRMKPGVNAAQVEADLQAIAAQLATAFPVTNKERSVLFAPVVHGNPQVRSIEPYAWMALGVVGIVLIIACFNVAGLLLARATEREREISVRSALGASRARILRQLMTEAFILAAFGGAAAMIVAVWSGDLLSAFSLPSPIPQRVHMPVDRRLVGFTAALAALAGFLPALLPALQATRANLVGTLKLESSIGGTRPSRARNLFVVAQIAGSTLFLAAAVLFVRSFGNIAAYDPGFDSAHSLTAEITPATYGYDRERAETFVHAAIERVSGIPGVTHAALADRAPFYVGFPKRVEVATLDDDCATAPCRTAVHHGVGRGHFAALGIPLLAGRDFTEQEISTETGAVVGATLAAQLWPGRNAVGGWFREGRGGLQRQVIGVVADVKHHMARDQAALTFYRPLKAEEFAGRLTILMRTADDPRLAIAAVRRQMQSLDADVPVYIRTMQQRMEIPMWPSRTAAGFLLVCGTLALILATVGLFGVTYYAVSQRTREFGVRVALGATPGRVMSLVLKEGLVLTIPGVLLGAAGAFAAARLLSNALFGISPGDPFTYATTAALQTLVALAACALPAYRATKADPMVALRQE